MEPRDQERLAQMEEHKLSSGDQRENIFQNGDLSCQKAEMSQNTSLKIPVEDQQREASGKKKCKVRKKAYKCTQCEKSFSCASALTQHQAEHSGQRIFECVNCGDRFTRSSSLILHLKTHKGEKPFVCTQCSQYFRRASELVAHLGLHT